MQAFLYLGGAVLSQSLRSASGFALSTSFLGFTQALAFPAGYRLLYPSWQGYIPYI